MAKKKYFNGSYGYVGWVEELGRNIEFSSEKEYLEFINDPEWIDDTKKILNLYEPGEVDSVEINGCITTIC